MNANELANLKTVSKSYSASFIIVRDAVNEILRKIDDLPESQNGFLKNIPKMLKRFDHEISKIIEDFDKIDKLILSEEEQSKLWELDDTINRLKTNLVIEEKQYRTKTRPTFAKSTKAVLDILNDIGSSLNDWREISEGLSVSIRNKVESIVMQKGIESSQKLLLSSKELVYSSKELEKSSNRLFWVTIILLIVGIMSVTISAMFLFGTS